MAVIKIDALGDEIIGKVAPEDMPEQWVHTQNNSTANWIIEHGLECYPAIRCKDFAGNTLIGDEENVSENKIIIHFKKEVSGKAYLII